MAVGPMPLAYFLLLCMDCMLHLSDTFMQHIM